MNNTYQPTTNYRKIYEQHYGPIPKEENGRTYEIHHIDSNRTNNNIENLMCVTIQEHFDIHYAQGDYASCTLIANSMKLSAEEKSNLMVLENQNRIAKGTHNFVGENNPSHLRVANGTHNLLGKNNPIHKRIADGTFHLADGKISSAYQQARVTDGTHPWLGGKIQQRVQIKRVNDGTHHLLSGDIQRNHQLSLVEQGIHRFQDPALIKERVNRQLKEGRHPSQIKKTCPHCGKTCDTGNYSQWHGDNCKLRS